MEKISVNQIIDVTVVALREFGALISTADGQKGLLHISEVSHFFVADVTDILKVGEKLIVKVLEIDASSGFIKVSLKQMSAPSAKRVKKHRQIEKIDENEIDFTPLKEMLPIWIKTAKEQTHD